MLRFFAFVGRQKEYVILGMAVALSVWMLSLQNDDKLRLAYSVSTPILHIGQRALSWPLHLINLKEENRRLEKMVTELSLENSELYEAKLENVRLRELLQFEKESQFELCPAEVIAWDADRTVNSILINIGHVKGIEKNMPVITPEGLVGKVYRVMPHESVVQLLLDPNCRLSGIIQRSQVLGIVEWERGTQCFLKKVPARSDVKEGDSVVTSGMGGIFPKGLTIGSVTDVTGERWELFKTVTLDPDADFAHLEQVFVLINENRTQSISSDHSAVTSNDAR